MKILVPFKRVPDYETGERSMINPFDEIALEEALCLRERGDAEQVTGVTIAGESADEQVRAALAMGIDHALRVDDDRSLDPYAVSRILAAVVRKKQPDLVIMGKQAVDDDANQTGQMLAGLLDWPQATFVSGVALIEEGAWLHCERETDHGIEELDVKLPAVVTTDLRLNEPRYVSLAGLMKARRRPIDVLSCTELGVNVTPRTRVISKEPVRPRIAGLRVESVEELLHQLRQVEKVL